MPDEEMPAGVPEGTEIVSPEGEKHKVVHDRDENGNLTGWHKEVVA